MKVRIDPTKCTGYGLCSQSAPEVFGLDEWNQAIVLISREREIPENLWPAIRQASARCPTRAIIVEP